jgi:hypothetical protein
MVRCPPDFCQDPPGFEVRLSCSQTLRGKVHGQIHSLGRAGSIEGTHRVLGPGCFLSIPMLGLVVAAGTQVRSPYPLLLPHPLPDISLLFAGTWPLVPSASAPALQHCSYPGPSVLPYPQTITARHTAGVASLSWQESGGKSGMQNPGAVAREA